MEYQSAGRCRSLLGAGLSAIALQMPYIGSHDLKRRGIMLVLSSPSGAGKTSIAREILRLDTNIKPSVSVTTRTMRPGEIDGRDYHFTDDATFAKMVKANALLENAQVFGHSYGTPREPVQAALHDGQDLIFDIDWQGARQLTENARDDLVTIFVLPPEADDLEQRLLNRAQDARETIVQRMGKAPSEMSHYPEYEYVIINRDLETSVAQVMSILQAERLKRIRYIGLAQFVRDLQQQVGAKYPVGELT